MIRDQLSYSVPGQHGGDIKMHSMNSQHTPHDGHPDFRYHQHYSQHHQPDEVIVS